MAVEISPEYIKLLEREKQGQLHHEFSLLLVSRRRVFVKRPDAVNQPR
jgi:hypothetical protein